MASNRRSRSGAVRFIPALKAVLLCSFIGGSCVGYVVQKNRIFEIGQQIGQHGLRLDRLKKENQALRDRLAAMQVPQRLAERARELKLGLMAPQPNQMLWITEPAILPGLTNSPVFHYVQANKRP